MLSKNYLYKKMVNKCYSGKQYFLRECVTRLQLHTIYAVRHSYKKISERNKPNLLPYCVSALWTKS